jgi:hypothetical protein
MENERAGLHELKLADLREQLREANRTIAALREGEKERVKLVEKVKDRDSDVAKVWALACTKYFFAYIILPKNFFFCSPYFPSQPNYMFPCRLF